MNLLQVGDRVLNLDNVTSVDLESPGGFLPDGSERSKVRVYFLFSWTGSASSPCLPWMDFCGEEAECLWEYFLQFSQDVRRYQPEPCTESEDSGSRCGQDLDDERNP